MATPDAPTSAPPREGFRAGLRRLRRNPLSFAGAALITLMVLMAIIGPWIVPYPRDGQSAIHLESRFTPPGPGHWFGTDEMGRDLLTRTVLGVRISLTTGVIVVFASMSIGTIVGAIAGYAGGWADEVLMRVTDAFLALPSLVLALAVAATLGASLQNALLAISIVWWPWYARLVRSQVITLRRREFVEAAKSQGLTDAAIIFRHIVPNSIAPIIVQASMDFGYVILTAASLGFLGLGAQPPLPEWGLMVSSGRRFLADYWWVATVPGLAIFVTVLSFNLLGDGLRDVLDPKIRDGD